MRLVLLVLSSGDRHSLLALISLLGLVVGFVAGLVLAEFGWRVRYPDRSARNERFVDDAGYREFQWLAWPMIGLCSLLGFACGCVVAYLYNQITTQGFGYALQEIPEALQLAHFGCLALAGAVLATILGIMARLIWGKEKISVPLFAIGGIVLGSLAGVLFVGLMTYIKH
jgi:uncharacterized membrane protein YagU involved in acid resistance